MYVVLEALDGPSVGARTNVAAGQTVRVGREAGNDFVVPQDPTLSRCHFHLYYDGSGCVVRNQSRYGTFVNNERVDAEGIVRDGDELRAGVCRFAVRFASDESVRNSTTPEMLAIRDDQSPVSPPPHAHAVGKAV
ncbi:MAG: FHA domain-containing protein, partial [Planctomycetota bacterium]|nr:FHA domain-containing protein [Planctomycetota bacterium]